MTTIIHKTDTSIPGNTIGIPDGQSNNTWSSLILFGKNFANYGSAVNNDMIALLENFSNPSPPPNPTQGQLWYNSISSELKVYDPKTGWTLININSIRAIAESIVKNRVYVSKNGNDNNSGLSWFAPKLTIAAACQTASENIAANLFDHQHVAIFVAAGDYTEVCPISVPPGVAIIGDNLRSVTVRPNTATSNVFLLDSKCYIFGLTVRGHSLYPSAFDITPAGYVGSNGNNFPRSTPQTGWAFSFKPGANINVSPYIQNCSSISGDPGTNSGPINNGVPAGGGGVLVDSNTIHPDSRIHSIVVDAFTQINLGGIGVKVVNKGYMQLVSFFVNFCQFGILCVDGGHITALNSNCSFGNYALWSEGSRTLDNDYRRWSSGTSYSLGNYVINDAGEIYLCTQAGTSAMTGFGPTGIGTCVTDGTVIWEYQSQKLVLLDYQISNGKKISLINGTQNLFLTSIVVTKRQIPDLLVQVNGVVQVLNIDYTIQDYLPPGTTVATQSLITFDSKSIPPANSTIRISLLFGSLVEASGYTMSYAGAGVTYGNKGVPNDLSPSQGGIGVSDPNKYTISLNGGRVYHTTTDESGDFYVGVVTPGVVDPVTGIQGSARPTFRINQRKGIIDGRAFYQSIFGFMTPFVLALTRKG